MSFRECRKKDNVQKTYTHITSCNVFIVDAADVRCIEMCGDFAHLANQPIGERPEEEWPTHSGKTHKRLRQREPES